MAKLYFRYGTGKTADLCQTAYNFNERGMNVLIINADSNKLIESKIVIDGKSLLTREPNFILDKKSLFESIYNMDYSNISCILVDNAHLLNKKQAEDLFFIANLLNITVITYGNRLNNNMRSEGSIRLMELANNIEKVDGDEILSRPKFEFYYGAMNCSKTAKMLYKSYALQKEGLKVKIIKPRLDRDEKLVSSRIGLSSNADIILDSNDSIYGEGYYLSRDHVNYILIDEAQFLTAKQIDELSRINKEFSIPIRCYGLKTDFLSNHFEGSGRMLEICDELVKMKTICSCGKGAIFNARKNYEGMFVNKGEQISIDNGTGDTYISLCPTCYIKNVMGIDNPKKLIK